MEALLLTLKGGESAARQEVKELIGVDGVIGKGDVRFSFENFDQIFKVCYFSQSAHRVVVAGKPESWLKEGMTFRVKGCSVEEEKKFANKIKTSCKVDLEKPDITFLVVGKNLTIDFSGDLSKRSFRIFTHKHTLKGTTAFVLLKEAGYTGSEVLVDPFAKDGTVVLEAAHYSSKRSVRFHDKNFPFMKWPQFKEFDFEAFFNSFKEVKPEKIVGTSDDGRDVEALRKNAKIAGITFLDFNKLELGEVEKLKPDLIVSFPPKLGKSTKDALARIHVKTVLLVNKDEAYPSKKEKIVVVGKEEKKIVWLK